MDRTILFYDIETTGLNKAFDQVIQFAGIRTDLELNEIERYEIKVKLNTDVVPSPGALLTHGINIDELLNGENEFEAIEKIHKIMNTPGTISGGYNTLGFDDEFLRFSFFRNLLPPYSHQYANGCSRFDVYPITVIYYLFKPEILNWPTIDNKPSLRLEHLNAENKFAQGAAHDAMVDVIVTVELAKKLRSEIDMWDYIMGYFDKDTDFQRMAKLPVAFSLQQQSFRTALMVNGKFGIKGSYQSFVLGLGRHNHYKNQTLWLRLDHTDFTDLDESNVIERVFVVNKKPGETGLLLPTNERFLKHLTQERIALVDKNIAWLKENPTLFQQILKYHRDFTYPKIPQVDTDAVLYQIGFLLPHEIQLCESFHQASLQEKIAMLPQFNNPVLRVQATRIFGRHYFDKSPDEIKQAYIAYLNQVNSNQEDLTPIDYRGQLRLTPQAALKEIADIETTCTLPDEQQKLLSELKSYLTDRFILSNAHNNDSVDA